MFVHLVATTKLNGVKYLYHFVAKSYDNVKKHRDVLENDYYLKQHHDEFDIRIITSRYKDFEKIKVQAKEFQNTFLVTDPEEFIFAVQRQNN